MSARPDSVANLPLVRVLNNIVLRLAKGLGQSVSAVSIYDGELEDLSAVIRVFPACWVTYLGCPKTEHIDTRRKTRRIWPKFGVMVGTQSQRANGSAALTGGPVLQEVGAATLLYMVAHLLAGQTFGLGIRPLQHIRDHVITQQKLNNQGCAIYSVEFATSWIEQELADGEWPMNTPGNLFAAYHGKTDQADPDMTDVHLSTGPLEATIHLQE